jgi:hypothetical protein
VCIAKWFGIGGDSGVAAQQLAIAQQQQQQAQAAVANANLDTESSRSAAEAEMRKAAASQGFSSTVFGTGTTAAPAVAYKALFGT